MPPIAEIGRPAVSLSRAISDTIESAIGFTAGLMPPAIEFDNLVAARIVPALLAYRPGRRAAAVSSPLLFCVSDTDSVAPPGPTLSAAARAPRAEIRRYAAGHFDFYLGAPFERLVADQAAANCGCFHHCRNRLIQPCM